MNSAGPYPRAQILADDRHWDREVHLQYYQSFLAGGGAVPEEDRPDQAF